MAGVIQERVVQARDFAEAYVQLFLEGFEVRDQVGKNTRPKPSSLDVSHYADRRQSRRQSFHLAGGPYELGRFALYFGKTVKRLCPEIDCLLIEIIRLFDLVDPVVRRRQLAVRSGFFPT